MSVQAMDWVSKVTVGRAPDKAVLVALANFHQQKDGECWASIETIAGFTELNRKTVMPALDRLREGGLIDFEKGSRKHRTYTLNFDVFSPNGGTLKNRDKSTNLGTKRKGAIVPTTDHPNSPNDGTLVGSPLVPTTDSYSPNDDVLKSQPLDHTQVHRNTLDNNLVADPPAVSDPKPPTKIEEEKYQRFARFMWEKIQPITGSTKQPNFNTWARDLRLLTTVDGRTESDVRRVFLWANADPFWQRNILSAAKLRKQFDQLWAKCAQEQTGGASTRHRSLAEDLSDTSWAQ